MNVNTEKECGSRSTYLVTYSQADREKIESMDEFAHVIINEFKDCNVLQWVSCEEDHKDGGIHYHCAIKLDRVKRWKAVRQNLQDKYKICVNFSDHHENYYRAYKYVTKNNNYITSSNHIQYLESPQTSKACKTRKRSAPPTEYDPSAAGPSGPRHRVDVISLYRLIVLENIKTDEDLCAMAEAELADGKPDLAAYVLNKSKRIRQEILQTAWQMKSAKSKKERSKKTRIEILRDCLNVDCECEGIWKEFALQIIENNNIDVGKFTGKLREALDKGRGKKNNIMLVGPANCGKSFLIKPLLQIYNTFVSPAKGTFSWVGAQKAEVVWLNDFRWSDKVIPWSDFLNLLEGNPVHVSAPKTHYAEDILWTEKTPIFSTSIRPIRKFDCGEFNEGETEMMDVRWTVFYFEKKIKNIVDTEPCLKCFAEMVLQPYTFYI